MTTPTRHDPASALLRAALASPTEPLDPKGLARDLGVGLPTVERWLSGGSRPSEVAIRRLERLFGIDQRAWPIPYGVQKLLDQRAAAAAAKEVA
jgi:hypothetical protein